MATPPSVPALAGTRVDYHWRLLSLGVQPLELEDFGGGLRPAVVRRIEPAIGTASGTGSPGHYPHQRLAAG